MPSRRRRSALNSAESARATGWQGSLRWALLGLLLCACGAFAQPEFPPLSGRVVDQAGVLPASLTAELTQRLATFERDTGIQLVVATLADLQDYAIEEYGYQLGRHWGIGREGEDTGVLLLVAPTEREVRIEVGYGLEGTLTDALSSQIIHSVILPRFRAGDLPSGVAAGATAVMAALQGEFEAPPQQKSEGDPGSLIMLFFFVVMFLLFNGLGGGPGGRRLGRRGAILLPGMLGGFGGGLGGGGGGFGGGFGGGGGSFGGGGASGGW